MFNINAAAQNGKPLPSFRLNSNPAGLQKWREIFLLCDSFEYKKRQVILEQGIYTGSVYYILKGLVEYTHVDKDGNERLIEIIGENSIFNLQPFFGGNVTLGSFVALEPTRVAPVKKDRMINYLADKQLAEELLREMATIVSGMTRQLWAGAEPANTRVEQVLYSLAENRLVHSAPGGRIFIDLSQSDLARISRTTRVTVTKAISRLKTEGIVEALYGGIWVKDLPGLKRMANLEEL